MISPLLSLDAEQSCRLLNETLAGHFDAIDAIAASGVRPRRFAVPDKPDREQIQRQATLIRFLSITESFSTERLHTEMDRILSPLSDARAEKMWLDAHGSAIKTWDGQRSAYFDWLAVDKKTWTDLLELTEARNAVAHGSGQLTWLQQQKSRKNPAAFELKLKRHLITLDVKRIVLTERSIEHAAAICTEFIKGIDASLAAP